MDQRLVAWARAVKARRKSRHPVLWLFTDADRLPNPLPAIAALPRGLCGVVFRPDGVADAPALARRVARLCRARRLALTVAGDWRLAAAVGAGVHLRGGKGFTRGRRLTTASAHNLPELRAGWTGGALVFLSPVFRTRSHAGAAGLGVIRWGQLAAKYPGRVFALGGVTGRTSMLLPRDLVAGAGAIGSLASPLA